MVDLTGIIKHQLSRRNLTPEQVIYYRGLQYEREKVKVTNSSGRNQYAKVGHHFDAQPKTAQKLAQQHKVSKPTIERDAQFARAVDTVDKAVGNGAKTALLSRDTKVTKQDAVKLGAIAESSPQTVRNVLEQVEEAHSPKLASQNIVMRGDRGEGRSLSSQDAASVRES